MKFSTKTLYGLKAVLVLAAREGQGSLSVSQIARRQMISIAYLEQILNRLKRKGLVKSVRGPQGGYVLAKKPSEITLESLLYAFEEHAFSFEDGGADETALANAIFWKKFKNALTDGLSKISLKNLMDEAHRQKKSKSATNYTFHI